METENKFSALKPQAVGSGRESVFYRLSLAALSEAFLGRGRFDPSFAFAAILALTVVATARTGAFAFAVVATNTFDLHRLTGGGIRASLGGALFIGASAICPEH